MVRRTDNTRAIAGVVGTILLLALGILAAAWDAHTCEAWRLEPSTCWTKVGDTQVPHACNIRRCIARTWDPDPKPSDGPAEPSGGSTKPSGPPLNPWGM